MDMETFAQNVENLRSKLYRTAFFTLVMQPLRWMWWMKLSIGVYAAVKD